MKPITKEFLVGSLFLLALFLAGLFAWLMGSFSPFSQEVQFWVHYSFAGGIEVGSPVRVAGVKVGRVKSIDFLAEPVSIGGLPATVKLNVTVSPKVRGLIREDSRFFINMAGIIGERYLEVSPGSNESPVLAAGASVHGVDPPRIDQLLSQGYGVFGRVQDFLENNEKTITEFLDQMNRLFKDANRLLEGKERHKLVSLVDNLNDISIDVKKLTRQLHEAQSQEFFDNIQDLVSRVHEIDRATLKQFLQEEGIRARIF